MTAHPIIVLWSHPRSMSTAIERIMRERRDMDCAHEPFMYDYYVHRKMRVMPHFDVQDGHPTRYEDIRDMLLSRAESCPVFFKDMAYYVLPQMLEDEDFLKRLTHGFLLRDPMASIASYHRLDPGVTCNEIGLDAQRWLYEGIVAATGQAPPVVSAEDVRADPRGVMGALWWQWGLSAADHAFDWQSEVPRDWRQVEGWHGDVIQATNIRPIDEGEQQRQAAQFEAQAKAAPQLLDYLNYHIPHYHELIEKKLSC
ncbi:sulfotransferase-like domain-containing protein [Ruegeria hyattellae]|uniref:sulfotransferase-like domain-containing protein n=1 Tax=Ruegeria hyattellae TaxID=3233337 RepID=UPI00355B5949